MQKVRPGQQLKIPANTYNSFIDAAMFVKKVNGPQGGGNRSFNFRKIFVKNDSENDLDEFEILGIDSPITTPTQDETEFKSRVAVSCSTPDADNHSGKFVILQEPIPAGDIGRGIISGETLVKVDIVDEDDEFAEITDGETGYLTSSSNGSARILWKEDGTGQKWALVRIGDSASGNSIVYQATADQSGGSIGASVTAKAIAIDGTLSTDEETLDVFDDAYEIRSGDLLIKVSDDDGDEAVFRLQGNAESPYTLAAGTGATAQTDTWDINDQPTGKQGVKVEAWFRLYWSGTSGDPIYQFIREGTYDSAGNLIAVSAETRSTAFTTDSCDAGS